MTYDMVLNQHFPQSDIYLYGPVPSIRCNSYVVAYSHDIIKPNEGKKI